ncbi:peptidase U32 [Thermotomaculum hydrothermale]|uniref:Peptidase U32 n=1 Tax=Thermotomaculum hydrothermale TaxID=981385 RepID=A0A7R6SYF7_9BACT|nr:peptidase U32 family protein [Thermotomaculum hydrothermale]BBB32506.1 peptidase U32 [Thermotomaculum hydrothermale]
MEEKKIKKPELLAPAGNFEKMLTAFHFGADAVYLGLKRFSLRNFAGNFTLDQLSEAVTVANELGKKVYVTLNIFPYDEDLEEIEYILFELNTIKPHGLIVSDPAIFLLAKELTDIDVHISTQLNVMNTKTANFWFKQGVSRIVVARELNLNQISNMCKNANGEIEVFVHGALCIAYSGRCFLSLYMTGRSANRGECTQSCRWNYKLLEEAERPGQYFPIEEDERGSYIFNSKDLCAIPVLDKLIDAGVASLKIEGRMKSMHYVAVTTDVYRTAIDLICEGKREDFEKMKDSFVEELSRVSNRGFTTNFFEGTPDSSSYNFESSKYINQFAFVGSVVNKTEEYIEILLKNPLSKGEIVELRDRGLKVEKFKVEKLFAANNGEEVEKGNPNTVVRVYGNFNCGVNSIVRK